LVFQQSTHLLFLCWMSIYFLFFTIKWQKPLQTIRKGYSFYSVSFTNNISLYISSKAKPTYVRAFGSSSNVFAPSSISRARRAEIVTNVYFESFFSCKLSTDGSSILFFLHYLFILCFNALSLTMLTCNDCLYFFHCMIYIVVHNNIVILTHHIYFLFCFF